MFTPFPPATLKAKHQKNFWINWVGYKEAIGAERMCQERHQKERILFGACEKYLKYFVGRSSRVFYFKSPKHWLASFTCHYSPYWSCHVKYFCEFTAKVIGKQDGRRIMIIIRINKLWTLTYLSSIVFSNLNGVILVSKIFILGCIHHVLTNHSAFNH